MPPAVLSVSPPMSSFVLPVAREVCIYTLYIQNVNGPWGLQALEKAEFPGLVRQTGFMRCCQSADRPSTPAVLSPHIMGRITPHSPHHICLIIERNIENQSLRLLGVRSLCRVERSQGCISGTGRDCW